MEGGLYRWVHPEWEETFPWLVQGTSGRGPGAEDGDLSLFREAPPPVHRRRWTALPPAGEKWAIHHSRQVHGARLLVHASGGAGLALGPEADGHATIHPRTLLTITVADCVPVFLVDPVHRMVALLHAGWRGVAEGILEKGVGLLLSRPESRCRDLLLHLGPSICGDCYEVGVEVHESLGLPSPGHPAPVDLRQVLAVRAVGLGIPPSAVTLSAHCTRCSPGSPFFSHRRGEHQRQVAFLGIRPEDAAPRPGGRPGD